jgi:hypothetical protein
MEWLTGERACARGLMHRSGYVLFHGNVQKKRLRVCMILDQINGDQEIGWDGFFSSHRERRVSRSPINWSEGTEGMKEPLYMPFEVKKIKSWIRIRDDFDWRSKKSSPLISIKVSPELGVKAINIGNENKTEIIANNDSCATRQIQKKHSMQKIERKFENTTSAIPHA